jgi:hypothetical protein
VVAGNSGEERARRLDDAVRAKILAKAALIAEAKGKIVIEAYQKGDGFDINLIVTT